MNEETVRESIAEWVGLPIERVRPDTELDKELNLDAGDLYGLAEWLMNDETRVPDCRWGVEKWKTVSDVISACLPED
jgi:acyl carrier protein